MEYEGMLERKVATLAAFALYFPTDWRAMKEAAAGEPDADELIYEYLEGLIKCSQMPISLTTHAEPNNSNASPSMAHYEGLEALQYLTTHSIPLKDFYKPGADANANTYSTATPIEQGKRYKAYIRGRFLCLDIDRGHKSGVDGVANLYNLFESMEKPRHLLPPYLRDIDRGNFPFYTKTPNGGYHLFFKYCGPYVTGMLAEGVEVKNLQVSAGWKDRKPYILYGELEKAPYVPAFIIDAIIPPQTHIKEYRPYTPEKKEWGRPSWALITEWTDKDGRAGAGRNNRAYSLACHAATHKWSQAETLAALQSDSSIDGLPQKEIQSAVNSAYSSSTYRRRV